MSIWKIAVTKILAERGFASVGELLLSDVGVFSMRQETGRAASFGAESGRSQPVLEVFGA